MKRIKLRQPLSDAISGYEEKHLILTLYQKIQVCKDDDLVKQWNKHIPKSVIESMRLSVISCLDLKKSEGITIEPALKSEELEDVVKMMDEYADINHSIGILMYKQGGTYIYNWELWRKCLENSLPLIRFLLKGKKRDKSKDEAAFKFLKMLIH